MGAYMAGIVSLSLSSSAFITEYFRSGIESVHRGQVEASRSLGFNLLQTMRLVVLPQAFRVVIPPLTGQMVGLIKATAIVSVVGLQELLKRAQEIMEWKTNPTPLVAVTIIYLIILLPLAHLSGILEKRMKKWVKKKA
jgi:polar amino acid transport system permease protein